jgi:hypothetical protein
MTTRILRDKRARSRPPWLDSYGHVQRTKAHACGRGCPAHDEADALKFAAARFLGDVYEILTGTGKHAGHKQKLKGACVGCSCGVRVQGRLNRG